MSKSLQLLEDYEKSMNSLQQLLEDGDGFVYRQASIKTFEITVELAWKLMKTYLDEFCYLVCSSLGECIRLAFSNNILPNDTYWFEIIQLRNRTVNTYSQKYIEYVYEEHLPKALKTFKEFYSIIKPKIQ